MVELWDGIISIVLLKKVHTNKNEAKRTVTPINLSNPVKKLVSPENI